MLVDTEEHVDVRPIVSNVIYFKVTCKNNDSCSKQFTYETVTKTGSLQEPSFSKANLFMLRASPAKTKWKKWVIQFIRSQCNEFLNVHVFSK